MSINLTGEDFQSSEYDSEVEILADELEDLIGWGANTRLEMRSYLQSEETYNSAEQVDNIDKALQYLEEEGRVSKAFKKDGNLDIGYKLE